MVALQQLAVRSSHETSSNHVAKLKSGGAFTILSIEITGEGTKLHIQMDKGKKGKGKTGWISALDRAGNPTVQRAPELSRQTDNIWFETDNPVTIEV